MIFAASLVCACTAEAQTPATYTGPNNGNWNTPGNWSGGVVPINGGGNTYAVTIPANRVVLFDVPGSDNLISSLTVADTSAVRLTAAGGGSLEVLGVATLGGAYSVSGDRTLRAVGGGTAFDRTSFATTGGGEIVVDTDDDLYNASHQGSVTVWNAAGVDGSANGSLLDLRTLTEISMTETNASDAMLTIRAADKGAVDLRNVANASLTGGSGDRLRFLVEEGANGTGFLRLDSLQSANRVMFDVRAGSLTIPALTAVLDSSFIITNGASLTATVLPALNRATVDVSAGGTVAFANVDEITNSSIALAGDAQLTTQPLGNIDGSRFTLASGAVFDNIAATTYAGVHAGNATVWSAGGVDGLSTGSVLDLQSLTQIAMAETVASAGTLTVEAHDKGTIDLRNVVSAQIAGGDAGDRLRFLAEGGANGIAVIRLDSLVTADRVTFEVAAGGKIVVGPLSAASMTNSSMSIAAAAGLIPAARVESTGDLHFGNSASLSMQAGSVLRMAGSLSYTTTTETNFLTGPGIVEMQGTNPRTLEVGGTDFGNNGSTSGNFGFGRLAVGTVGVPTTVVLLDALDNGNRTGVGTGQDEALYLFGAGGQNGLQIAPGSVAVLYGVDVYSYLAVTGQQMHLNGLFPPGVTEIAYDQGHLRLLPNIEGDFNSDGVVDALDYVIWRNTLDDEGPDLPADADHDQKVGESDFNIWKDNYGNTVLKLIAGGGGLADGRVPEPTSNGLLITAMLIAASCRARFGTR